MKKLITILFLLSIVSFVSCDNNKSRNVDMGYYTIDIPHDWKKIKLMGIDSEVNAILTPSNDTIISDLGNYSEKFDETNKVFSNAEIIKYKSMGMETSNLFSSDTPEIDQAQGTFLKEYYMYFNVDNCNAKFRIPKFGIKGVTGISITNIKKTKNRLVIISQNLDANEQNLLINSFKTIKFK